jgi:DNA adenine methylase
MRTPLTYYGGKQKLADSIVSLMPPHKVYLEPFVGGGAVLFRKPRASRETVNDIDGAVVAFWRALRNQPQSLARGLELTPYAREEWRACFEGLADVDVDDLERARRLITAIDQSYSRSGDSWSPPSLLPDRRGRWQPGSWDNLPTKIVAAADRLRGVAVEHCDALGMLPRWDIPETVIYCDPPYTGEHRINTERTRGYRYDDHPDLWPQLIECLLAIEHAAVLLSGYPCDATDQLVAADWTSVPLYARRHSQTRLNSVGSMAPETIWLSPTTPSSSLFEIAT